MPLTNKLNFNDDGVLIPYIGSLIDKKITHSNYEDNIEQAQEMGVHIKGDNPKHLLESYRPNEPTEVRNYRLEIYEPITKSQGKRIVNVISKIQQNSNYSVKFPEQKNVSNGDSLEQYTTKDYPHFGSVVEWAFSIALKQDLIDANSLVVVMPLVIPDDNVTFLKPFTFVYRSDQVLDHGLNYYTILLDEKNIVKDLPLNMWLIVTDSQILKIKQISETDASKVEIEVLFEFDFGEAPAFFMKGDYREETIPFAYDSFISGILPYFNKVVRMDSDLDAQYNQHLFLERVEIEIECTAHGCQHSSALGMNVITKLVNGVEKEVACSSCNGKGWINGRSPLGVTSVRKDMFEGENSSEFPGVTYIDKPTEIITLTENKIKELISQGFASINMDIIDRVGENQSGVAKSIDRSELNGFLGKISDNLFDNIIYNSFKFISLWRYSVVDEVTFPVINKPTSFNALNESLLVEEIKTISEAGLDTTQYELDLIDKKYPNDHDKQLYNKNVLTLDPLAGKSGEEKVDIRLSGGITQEQFIISSNIRGFLLDAIEEDEDFLNKSRKEKQMKLDQLAKAQIIKPISNADTQQAE
jgi:hypothetical protein